MSKHEWRPCRRSELLLRHLSRRIDGEAAGSGMARANSHVFSCADCSVSTRGFIRVSLATRAVLSPILPASAGPARFQRLIDRLQESRQTALRDTALRLMACRALRIVSGDAEQPSGRELRLLRRAEALCADLRGLRVPVDAAVAECVAILSQRDGRDRDGLARAYEEVRTRLRAMAVPPPPLQPLHDPASRRRVVRWAQGVLRRSGR